MLEAKLRDKNKPSGKRAEAICPPKDWDGLQVHTVEQQVFDHVYVLIFVWGGKVIVFLFF